MSEWTPEQVRWAKVCEMIDAATAARLEADVQPVDDAAVLPLSMTTGQMADEIVRLRAEVERLGLRVVNLGGELLAMQRCAKGMQAERDEARAEIERLKKEGESHEQVR